LIDTLSTTLPLASKVLIARAARCSALLFAIGASFLALRLVRDGGY
jgi:hypothetical protein